MVLLAIFRSFCTSMVGSGIRIFGSSRGGAAGGVICWSANFGNRPLDTGAGPFCPPPPPILFNAGSIGGGVSSVTSIAFCTAI